MKLFSIDKLFSLIFGLIVFAFYAFLYPFHLNYQEQYQMFLFSSEYLVQLLAKPGGFSDYVGNFFIQFYFYTGLGALILSVFLVALQRSVWWLSKKMGARNWVVPFSAIPAILYWALLCDESYLLGGLISILITVGFLVGYLLLKRENQRILSVLIAIPILYWFAGGSFLIFPIFVLVNEWIHSKMNRFKLILFLLGALVLVAISPFIAKLIVVQLPMRRLWIGVNYYRFPMNWPIVVAIVGGLIVAIPFVISYLSEKITGKKERVGLIGGTIFVLIFGGLFISRGSDMAKEEVMAYDFNTRMRRWTKVIALADKKTPMSPLSVSCLNLALAQEGQLSSRMFFYYQNGYQGLMPDFIRDYTLPMIAGEVYYHLGFINTAQRFAFEAMEALPDYQKSVRAIMRLAETNIINGDYVVARKYLHLLQKTFYYRSWATNALKIIEDDKQVEAHPEWGLLRRFQTKEDFLFSEGEKDMMLGLFFKQNHENWMAFEYLMAYCLLNKDLEHFHQYFPLIQSLQYKTIPLSYQEALLYLWEVQNNDPSQKIPFAISNVVVDRFQQYGQIYHGSGDREKLLQKQFSNTYWYYYHFR